MWISNAGFCKLFIVFARIENDKNITGFLVENNPENGILKYATASALEERGDLSGAYALFEEIVDSSEHYPHIQANACFRMARSAPLKKRQELLRKCIKLNPSHQGAQSMLGETTINTTKDVVETLIQTSSDNPLVSIIVPNWNGMRFVGMCLDSLAQLHFENFEVIVVDNGSMDGSREMIEEKYPWVRLLKLPQIWGSPLPVMKGSRHPTRNMLFYLTMI